NLSDVATASIAVDTLPPAATTLTVSDGPRAVLSGYTDRGQVTLHLSAIEQHGDLALVKLANTPSGLSTAAAVPVSSEIAWSLDLALSLAVTDATPVQLALSETPSFAGALFFAPTSSKLFQVSAGDGTKTIWMRSRDAAGNTADTSATFQLKTTPPSAVLQV